MKIIELLTEDINANILWKYLENNISYKLNTK